MGIPLANVWLSTPFLVGLARGYYKKPKVIYAFSGGITGLTISYLIHQHLRSKQRTDILTIYHDMKNALQEQAKRPIEAACNTFKEEVGEIRYENGPYDVSQINWTTTHEQELSKALKTHTNTNVTWLIDKEDRKKFLLLR